MTELELSPTGKELAVVIRGEVFVASVEHGATRRITSTPTQERSVSFSPDGRTLLYAGERDGSWNLYQTRIARDEEPYFWNATRFAETTVLATPAEEFQPRWSPDGKEIAYLEERTTLKVLDVASGTTRVVLPGGSHLLLRRRRPVVRVVPGRQVVPGHLPVAEALVERGGADRLGRAKPLVNLTRSGFEDSAPRWMMDGEVMIWASDRNGLRAQGARPASRTSTPCSSPARPGTAST